MLSFYYWKEGFFGYAEEDRKCWLLGGTIERDTILIIKLLS